MSTALALAPRMAVARIRGGLGGITLDVFAVIAYVVSSFLALTVAGGTWMFVQRFAHMEVLPPDSRMMADAYPILAGFACALLIVPILNLGGAAARLGAKGRERRLASLRLIGMTGREVVTMSLFETVVQAGIGILVGVGAYVASLPLWQFVTFQRLPISAGEMLVPLWLGAAVVIALLLLSLASTALGLQRVRISPLGVAHQDAPAAVRHWRLIVIVVAVLAFFIAMNFVDLRNGMGIGMVIVFAILSAVVGAVNLLGPIVLQIIARIGVRSGKIPRMVAMRRILDNPKGAWRNVSAVAFLGFVAAFTAMTPWRIGDTNADSPEVIFVGDIRRGVIITLLVGFLLAAVSVLLAQASAVYERAEQAIALDRMGMPRNKFAAIRRREVVTPLLSTLAISIGTAVLLSLPFQAYEVGLTSEGWIQIGITIAVGVVLTLLAAEACRPVQSAVLSEQRRRND